MDAGSLFPKNWSLPDASSLSRGSSRIRGSFSGGKMLERIS